VCLDERSAFRVPSTFHAACVWATKTAPCVCVCVANSVFKGCGGMPLLHAYLTSSLAVPNTRRKDMVEVVFSYACGWSKGRAQPPREWKKEVTW
jgi:hypothetical protein